MDLYFKPEQRAAFTTLLELILCPVCEQPLTDPYVTDCEHDFCKSCIEKFVHKTNECPVCKVTVLPRDIRRNHTLNSVAKAFSAIKRDYEVLQTLLSGQDGSNDESSPKNSKFEFPNETNNLALPVSPCKTIVEPSLSDEYVNAENDSHFSSDADSIIPKAHCGLQSRNGFESMSSKKRDEETIPSSDVNTREVKNLIGENKENETTEKSKISTKKATDVNPGCTAKVDGNTSTSEPSFTEKSSSPIEDYSRRITASVPSTQQLEEWSEAIKSETEQISISKMKLEPANMLRDQKESSNPNLRNQRKDLPVVAGSRLTLEQQDEVRKICRELGWRFVEHVDSRNASEVSHLLLNISSISQLQYTPKILMALCSKSCFILKLNWIRACFCAEGAVAEGEFLITNENTERDRSNLMHGQLIYLAMEPPSFKTKSLDYDTVKVLLTLTGAKVRDLSRLLSDFRSNCQDDILESFAKSPNLDATNGPQSHPSQRYHETELKFRSATEEMEFSAEDMISTVERPVILAQHKAIENDSHSVKSCQQCQIWTLLLRSLKVPILDPIWLVDSIKQNSPQPKSKFCVSQHLRGHL